MGRYHGIQSEVFHQMTGRNCMGNQPLALGPVLEFRGGKYLVQRLHQPLGPYAAGRRVHPVFQDLLHKAVNVERVVRNISVNETEPSRCFNSGIPRQRVPGGLRQRLAQFLAALGEDFFGDGIGREERTGPHQVGRCRIRLFHLGKGQGKSNRH